jgi:hypothetical protein
MIRSRLINFIFISIIIASCNNSQENIDVSKQWKVDYYGNLILGLNDGQWGAKVFTTQEQNLFNDLDTANLTGTVKPDSVLSSSTIIPNPFKTQALFAFSFSNGFNGQIEFKFVIVDSHMNIVDKRAIRIQGTSYPNIPLNPSGSGPIPLTPKIPVGSFRIYYSLSAQSSQNFYTSWGNIQQIQ